LCCQTNGCGDRYLTASDAVFAQKRQYQGHYLISNFADLVNNNLALNQSS
jgi:hypothetical protein